MNWVYNWGAYDADISVANLVGDIVVCVLYIIAYITFLKDKPPAIWATGMITNSIITIIFLFLATCMSSDWQSGKKDGNFEQRDA